MKKFLFTTSLALFVFGLEAQQKGGSQLADGQQPAVNGITFAVVVGISDYQDKDIPDLRFAETRYPRLLNPKKESTLNEAILKITIGYQCLDLLT